MITDPTIICPQCQAEIRLTESLAAPLIESTRRRYEQQIAEKDDEVAHREAAVRHLQAALAKDRESLDEQVAAKVKAERAGIAAAEAQKARDALADEIAKAQQEKTATENLLKDRDAKRAEQLNLALIPQATPLFTDEEEAPNRDPAFSRRPCFWRLPPSDGPPGCAENRGSPSISVQIQGHGTGGERTRRRDGPP